MNLLSFLLMILFTATCNVVAELEFPFQYEVKYFGYHHDRQFESNVIVFHENQKFHYKKNKIPTLEGTWEWNRISQYLKLEYVGYVQNFVVYEADAKGNIPIEFVSTTAPASNSRMLSNRIDSFRLVGTPSMASDTDLLAVMEFPFEIGKEYYGFSRDQHFNSSVLIFWDMITFIYKTITNENPIVGKWTWDGSSRQLKLVYFPGDNSQTWQIWSQEEDGKIPVKELSGTYSSTRHGLLAKRITSFILKESARAAAPIDPNSYSHYDQDNYISFSDYPSSFRHNNQDNYISFSKYPEHSDHMAPVTDEGEPSAPNYNYYNEQDYYTGTSDYSVLDDFTPEDYHTYFDPNFKQ